MIGAELEQKLRELAASKYPDSPVENILEAAGHVWRHLQDRPDKAERLLWCMANICAQGSPWQASQGDIKQHVALAVEALP